MRVSVLLGSEAVSNTPDTGVELVRCRGVHRQPALVCLRIMIGLNVYQLRDNSLVDYLDPILVPVARNH